MFYIELKDKPNKNKIILHNDNSFGQAFDNKDWDIQIALNNTPSFFLNFNLEEKKCVSCEGYIIQNKKTLFHEIKMKEYYSGALKILDKECIDEYIDRYFILKNNQICLDRKNNRLGIGDFNLGNWYLIGDGQFAVFKDDTMIGFVICF